MSRENDNIETVPGLAEVITDFLDEISLPFPDSVTDVEALEFRQRDGFIPSQYNHGGFDLLCVTDVSTLIGSGFHSGLRVEGTVNKLWEEAIKASMDSGKVGEEVEDDAHADMSGDHASLAWRVRVIYEGGNKIYLVSGYDLDGPYFRWRERPNFVKEISFTNLTDLKAKLGVLIPLIEKEQ